MVLSRNQLAKSVVLSWPFIRFHPVVINVYLLGIPEGKILYCVHRKLFPAQPNPALATMLFRRTLGYVRQQR